MRVGERVKAKVDGKVGHSDRSLGVLPPGLETVIRDQSSSHKGLLRQP